MKSVYLLPLLISLVYSASWELSNEMDLSNEESNEASLSVSEELPVDENVGPGDDELMDVDDESGNQGYGEAILKEMRAQRTVLEEMREYLKQMSSQPKPTHSHHSKSRMPHAHMWPWYNKNRATTGKSRTLASKLAQVTLDQGGCQAGWFFNTETNKCYTVQAEKTPWLSAKEKCMEKNARLVTVADEKELLFVSGIINSQKAITSVWVGGKFVKDKWVWDMGSEDKEVPMTYAPWLPKEPNNVGNKEYHVQLHATNKHLGYNDLNEHASLPSICELDME